MVQDPAYNSAQRLKGAQKKIYAGQFHDALDIATDLLEIDTNHIEALYIQAVSQRYLDQTNDALSTLENLIALSPEFGRAHQEKGHLHRALGQKNEALIAYQQACSANPGLEASWRAQAEILHEMSRLPEAQQAMAQAERLKSLPHELFSVTNLIHEGKLLIAESHCRAFLKMHKKHVEGMRLLAEIGAKLGALSDAELLLEMALEFEPDNIQVRLDYIDILRKQQNFDAALKQAKHLYDQNPDNPIFQSRYAIENLQVSNFELALKLFDRVLEKLPKDSATLTSRGHALKTLGRQDEAVASYHQACQANRGHGDAYYALANLKTYQFSLQELQEMQEQEKSPATSHHNRIQFCFALGKGFEDQGLHDKSFHYYQQGNAYRQAQSRYDPDQMEEELKAQADVCTRALFETHRNSGCLAPDPIFIVGLPRAGSTLIEQVLASHSQVDGTLELPNILSLSHRLRDRQKVSAATSYPKILHQLSDEQLNELGRTYIEDTRIHRANAPFFTDKMPNNFRHIGLIHLILPNAKIIDARREPMACCFSGFKQLFAEGQEFTYGLQQIGRYYRDYVGLMRHWDDVLPGKVLRVYHDDMIEDLEAQVRRILHHCSLDYEEQCLEFYRTERAVRTASSEQVRQPIFKSGMAAWKRYEAHLGPLKEALGPALDHY